MHKCTVSNRIELIETLEAITKIIQNRIINTWKMKGSSPRESITARGHITFTQKGARSYL